jgi:hypothetical protein
MFERYTRRTARVDEGPRLGGLDHLRQVGGGVLVEMIGQRVLVEVRRLELLFRRRHRRRELVIGTRARHRHRGCAYRSELLFGGADTLGCVCACLQQRPVYRDELVRRCSEGPSTRSPVGADPWLSRGGVTLGKLLTV